MRALLDRLAEAIRISRVGNAKPQWDDLPEPTQEDYRNSARGLLGEIGKSLRFSVKDEASP